MHHIILGAGPAGVTGAETIRKQAPDARITLIGGEPEPPYSRMAIPYLLQGDIDERGTYLRQNATHFDDVGIDHVTGRIGAIDTDNRSVSLSDGTVHVYDRLLIATGASPHPPPIPGADLPGVHTCWTLADAREILQRAGRGMSVVLIGAGFIGSIVLEALHARGCQLTVVEVAPRMVARMMDEVAGGMLTRWCETKDVRVLTNTRVEAINTAAGDDAALTVALSNGTETPASLVVLATGVRPNTSFLADGDILVNEGVRVDDFLHTSVPHVYAAGDCCEAMDMSTGAHDVLAIQPTAVEHGRIAGLNMAGIRTPHAGSLNMNVLDTMGLISSSFGLWQGTGAGDNARTIDNDGYRYVRLEFDDDRLVGAQCVGLTDHVGIFRGLIQTRLRLGAWKDRLKASPERVREAYIAVAQGAPLHGPTAAHVALPV